MKEVEKNLLREMGNLSITSGQIKIPREEMDNLGFPAGILTSLAAQTSWTPMRRKLLSTDRHGELG